MGSVVGLPLLASHSLEVVHVSSRDGGTDELQMVDPCHVRSVLVVLHEYLDVLHVLELDVAEGHRLTTGQISRAHSEHENYISEQ